MSNAFDVVCIGNAKIDVFLSIHEASENLRLNKDTNELCIKSGEKIQVDKCDFLLGGNAANVAVALSRLKLQSAICAEIGDDELSQKIIHQLTKENVNITHLLQTKGSQASFSMVLNFKGERTIFSEHVDRLHNFSFDNLATRAIYLTSLGHEWKTPYQKVFEFAKQKKILLAFNPGTLQIEEGYNAIANILSITDILFINKEEAARISNSQFLISNEKGDKEIINQLLIKLQKLEPKIVVITDGKNGSYAIDEKGEMFMYGAVPCRVVEKTGAGDAYSAGFVAATLHGLSIKEAMAWGALNAASVIEKIGAQAGLLKKEEMQERLK